MTPAQIVILLAMTAYAVYRQSRAHRVEGRTRFKLALVYAGVGLLVGGYVLPPDTASWVALAISVLASLCVGVARGRMTRLDLRDDGHVYSRGTAVTIGLFLALVGAKFAWGAWQYVHAGHPHGGFGEVLLLIAAMAAVQAEIVWRRAAPMRSAAALRPRPSPMAT